MDIKNLDIFRISINKTDDFSQIIGLIKEVCDKDEEQSKFESHIENIKCKTKKLRVYKACCNNTPVGMIIVKNRTDIVLLYVKSEYRKNDIAWWLIREVRLNYKRTLHINVPRSAANIFMKLGFFIMENDLPQNDDYVHMILLGLSYIYFPHKSLSRKTRNLISKNFKGTTLNNAKIIKYNNILNDYRKLPIETLQLEHAYQKRIFIANQIGISILLIVPAILLTIISIITALSHNIPYSIAVESVLELLKNLSLCIFVIFYFVGILRYNMAHNSVSIQILKQLITDRNNDSK